METRFPLFVVTGPPGIGKTTFPFFLNQKLSFLLNHIKKNISRPVNEFEKARLFTEVSEEEILNLKEGGTLLDFEEDDGTYLCHDPTLVDHAADRSFCIISVPESDLKNYYDAGFFIHPIYLIPDTEQGYVIPDENQEILDSTVSTVIKNSFAEGGKEHAIRKGGNFVLKVIKEYPHLNFPLNFSYRLALSGDKGHKNLSQLRKMWYYNLQKYKYARESQEEKKGILKSNVIASAWAARALIYAEHRVYQLEGSQLYQEAIFDLKQEDPAPDDFFDEEKEEVEN